MQLQPYAVHFLSLSHSFLLFFSFSREGKRAGLVINMLLNLYSRQQILHVGPTIPRTHSLILRLRKHTSLLANI